ncbi:hypothetical protein [Domibacillus epiphyticus]|uniref:RNA polymerase subunit sigma n=1 Tax=Domibacillus epiphyticus TaxID=1714355 RepID=A0A1V2ACA5_9BACI|nr:hypothetical protein [Domibacillus epiphyticus]OMP68628.1 hypothetical protein BTO28_00835 [Domibacillus epiphyticus]
MDFKSVEMQVALPRTFEASKAVQEQQQNGLAAQQNANEDVEKEAQWKRKAVVEGDNIDKLNLKDRDRQNEQQRQRKKKKQEEKKKSAHPFKGKQIDISG